MNILPGADRAVIPLQKLVGYALSFVREPNKTMAFQEALGYDINNADALAENILENITKFNAIRKPDNSYGARYGVLMTLIGANGKTANVMTAWIVEYDSRETRLTSVYVTKKRIRED
jgi:hypothetical protein